MTTTELSREDTLERLAAREYVLRLVALAASDPASARFAHASDPELHALACSAARQLAADPALQGMELAPGESSPESLDLTALATALSAPQERLSLEHTRVFGLVVSKECPPYETPYCPQTFSVYRSQVLADIGGFYRAFGVTVGRDAPERVDHIACELEFLAWLVAKERYALAQEGEPWVERARIAHDAQVAFVSKHLAWWVPAFARALGDHVRTFDPPPSLGAALSPVLAALIPVERALLGIDPPQELAAPRVATEEEAEGCGGCAG